MIDSNFGLLMPTDVYKNTDGSNRRIDIKPKYSLGEYISDGTKSGFVDSISQNKNGFIYYIDPLGRKGYIEESFIITTP